MIGASIAMRRWAVQWRRENNATMAEALWAMGHTYFWTINGVEQAYTAEYQKKASVQDMVNAMVLQINGNVPGVRAEAEGGTVVISSEIGILGSAFTITPGEEDGEEDALDAMAMRREYYQAQHDRRHAIWRESQKPSYYDGQWEDDGIYEKPVFRPCPTCILLGRQCSTCAGHFTYAE